MELTPKGSIDRHMTFDEYMTDPKIKELRSSIQIKKLVFKRAKFTRKMRK